jgi:sugar phosphate isomerase/epimerase
MRLGGPIFKKAADPKTAVDIHRKLGFGAAFATFIEDDGKRKEFVAAFKEADITLAEYGAYCINILDTDPSVREQNIQQIMTNLRRADEMGVRCCIMHGGSVQTGGWGAAHRDNFSAKSFDDTVAIVQRIVDEVKPSTTKLTMETESYLLPDSPQEYLRIIKAVDREEFAVHLDPVNITSSPRLFYANGAFIKECFEVLGPWIVSCHAKDTNIVDHLSVQITETFVGDGHIDYDVYLKEIEKLTPNPTLMIEHLSEAQLKQGLDFLFAKAESLGITFENSSDRDPSILDGSNTEYFAPHLD